MGRAVDKGVVKFGFVNPRDFTTDAHRSVDDRPYGGGPGMVMLCDPLAQALKSVERPGRMLLMSPRGRPLTQELATELAAEEALTIVCGRYEGIDERLMELFPLEPVSVGDYVLTGGETGALCVLESVARLKPGFMGKEASGEEESFAQGLLEYPHYTRPEEFQGLRVPEVLASGNHAAVARWRRDRALETTLATRPEMLDTAMLDKHDAKLLRELPRPRLGRGLYVALLHHPVYVRGESGRREIGTTSLTNLDVHDISRVSRSYGCAGLYLVTPLDDQRDLAASLIDHWVDGPGQGSDRAEALSLARTARDLGEVLVDVERRAGSRPLVVATSAQGLGSVNSAQLRERLAVGPVVLVLGTGHGLAKSVIDAADGLLRPIRWAAEYNHLPVRAALTVYLERIIGDYR